MEARRDRSLKKNTCHYFSNTPLFIADAGSNSFPVTVNQTWLLLWKLGYLIITILEGEALMHTVCRKTKAKAFGDFAYNFTEATSRNIESRKDVCFEIYQNHSMKGATNKDLEA